MTNTTQPEARPGKYWARLCALPKFSFLLSPAGGVARVEDTCGNWVEASEVQQLVDDAESRITELEKQLAAKHYEAVAMEAQAAEKCLHQITEPLSEQDAGLLEQAASMLEALEGDERNRGNSSTAEGAGCSAHAVRRLAVQLLQAAPPAQAQPECERCGLSPAEHDLMHWCDNQSFQHDDGSVQLGVTPTAPAAVAVPEDWMENLGFELDSPADGVWLVIDDTGARREANLTERVLWKELVAIRAALAAAPAQEHALEPVRQAVRDYYFALDTRQHGGVAAHKALGAIQEALGLHWAQGQEIAARAAQGGAA